MKISLENIGKRYNNEWIFRGVSTELASGQHCAILGSNGSGKSTLLQVINSNQSASEGSINYSIGSNTIPVEKVFKYASIATPYLELMEEFTMHEMLKFHASFKPYLKGVDIPTIIEILGLEKSKDKELKYFSSGMKQRVKLALAVLSDTPLVLLDEPTSNLDKNGIEWYCSLVEKYSKNRLFIVCSNQQKDEYFFCTQTIQVEDFK